MEKKLWLVTGLALAMAGCSPPPKTPTSVLQDAQKALGSVNTIQYSGTGMSAFVGQALTVGPGRHKILQRHVVERTRLHGALRGCGRIACIQISLHFVQDCSRRRHTSESLVQALRLFARTRLQ